MRIEALDRKERASGWEAYENYKLSLQTRKGTEATAAPEDLAAAGSAESAVTKGVNAPKETGSLLEAPDPRKNVGAKECETCANRKYQDGSDDPGVSFKTPTKLSPDQAASAVRGHEMEHVSREQSKAQQEGRQVVSQFITYHTGICPECGKAYVSGGTTTTTTRGKAAYAKTQEQPTGQLKAYA